MNNIRLLFAKEGRAVYISHLDLMHTLQRSISRAGYRIKYSEGFNPHPQISIALPLSLGVSSRCEIADIKLTESADEKLLPEQLTRFLPEGIRVLEAYAGERKPSEIKWIDIKGRIITDGDVNEKVNRINELFSRENVSVLKKSKRRDEVINIKDGISIINFESNGKEIIMKARLSAVNPTVNPALVINAINENIKDIGITGSFFSREQIYDENFEVFR